MGLQSPRRSHSQLPWVREGSESQKETIVTVHGAADQKSNRNPGSEAKGPARPG